MTVTKTTTKLLASPAILVEAWSQIEPEYQALLAQTLGSDNISGWLASWSRASERVGETHQRLFVATTVATTDEEIARRYANFLDGIFPRAEAAEQALKEKLLASGLEPAGFEVPLRNLRTQAEIYRAINLPLQSREMKLNTEYDKIAGAQTIPWEGQELTLAQLRPLYQAADRDVRERAWRLAAQRALDDRAAINRLWVDLLKLRLEIAHNAGFSDYRAYRWKQMLRFDYTPDDCRHFADAIEAVVVPAAGRIYARRRQRLGVETLRPWDLAVDPLGRPALQPFRNAAELEEKTARIFQAVDPQLGAYFATLRQEGWLDLENRKGKAPGAYSNEFPVERRPFIFANAVGIHDDVQTLLHEGGHAFHTFEAAHLPYYAQREVSMEFSEVASMGMELLAAPYLEVFYTPEEAARARVEHLESSLLFWPYMAVVDAFQHWVYTHPETAQIPDECDACWAALWDRFMGGVDWSGLEAEKATAWQRKLHIIQAPFYYVEYGLAQLGAMQVWRNALQDQAGEVAAYRRALSLGGTVPLPGLYAAAGARFAFDAATLKEAVDLAERTIQSLEEMSSRF